MQRLITRLIDSRDPAATQAALRWLYGFVRPQRFAIAGLLGCRFAPRCWCWYSLGW